MKAVRSWVFAPILFVAALVMGSPAAAQQEGGPDTAAAEQASEGEGEDSIVVSGILLRDPEELPVAVSPPSSQVDRTMRQLGSEAEMFSRCAQPPRPVLLHRILDGRAETAPTERALHQHMVSRMGCLQDLPTGFLPPSPFLGRCNPDFADASKAGSGMSSGRTPLVGNLRYSQIVCRADLDRGFLYEAALRQYAPDLRLSRSHTFDHATRERFREREEERNAARSTASSEFFFVVSCMAQIRPEYATALLREQPGSEAETRLRAMLISDGAACMGNPAEVKVDARQFRAFLAEAVYSWAVAVKRTDTLLPMEVAAGA